MADSAPAPAPPHTSASPGPLKSAAFTLVFLLLLGLGVEGLAWLVESNANPYAAEVIGIEDHYRTSPQSMFVLDRDLLWRPRPHYETEYRYLVNLNPMQAVEQTYHVRLNAQGFRGPELRDARPAVRLACLGDSVTFGLNAPDEFTYPAVVQQQLDRVAPGRVEVINAGVPSYSSDHGVLWLEQVILPLKPDFVILAYGHNDVWMHPREMRVFLAAHGRSDWRAVMQRGLTRSAAYRRYKRAVLRAREAAAPDAVDPERANKTYDNYTRMLAMLRDRGIPSLILVLYNQRPITVAQLQQAGATFQVPVRDVRPLFVSLGPDRLMSEQRHPNTRGYAVLGAWLADDLAPRLGLPKPPPLQPHGAPEQVIAAQGAGRADEG